ncbi:MAG TPA: hypothetical protein H9722_02270 [Candidatus Mediterraneibacter pullistercoris]|nr:hypothetical protein [Candidatus Mediterraneibacter pullistercoris]
MDRRIRELYNCMEQKIHGTDIISKEIYEKIMELTQEEKNTMDWRTYEKYRDKLFLVASIAEEGGFVKGFRCASALMAEALHGADEFNVKPE